MQENILTHSRPNCYICETEGRRLYEGLTDFLFGVSGEWNFRKCRNPECGLLWLAPMPRVEDIPKLYRKYYTHVTDKSLPDYAARLYERVREGILASSFGYREASKSMFWRLLGRALAYVPFLKKRIGGTIMWLNASQ